MSALSSAAGKVSMKEGKAPHGVSILSSATSEVFAKEGEEIPFWGGEVTSDGKNSWKTQLFAEPANILQHKLALLQGRLIHAEEATPPNRPPRWMKLSIW